MATGGHKSATPAQVAAWKKRTGHSNRSAAEYFNVNERTFCRWLLGETTSPKWLGDTFREGAK